MHTQSPIFITLNLLASISSLVGFMCGIRYCILIIWISLIFLMLNIALWIKNVIDESYWLPFLLEKSHFIKGFYIFIITEVSFFSSFFWAYYNFLLDPSLNSGGVWLPIYYTLFVNIPMHYDITTILMNVILVTLGLELIIQSAHCRSRMVLDYLPIYMGLSGEAFLRVHFDEYALANLDICNGIYSSVYYSITGLHGAHVLIGIFFLIAVYMYATQPEFNSYAYTRVYYGNIIMVPSKVTKTDRSRIFFLSRAHVFILASFYYWHLIDMVWILVLATQYVHYSIQDTTDLNGYSFISEILTLSV